MTFNRASIDGILSRAESKAQALAIFRSVNGHEPKSAPTSGLTCSVWIDELTPIPRASGLNSTSGILVLNMRLYGNILQKPEDEIDPNMASAASLVIEAFSNDFTLGGTIRNVDLLGQYGASLRAKAGYLTIDNHMYRVMTITLPCIVNDLWSQVE